MYAALLLLVLASTALATQYTTFCNPGIVSSPTAVTLDIISAYGLVYVNDILIYNTTSATTYLALLPFVQTYCTANLYKITSV